LDYSAPVEAEGWGRGADMVAFKNQCEGGRHLQEAAGDLKKGNKILWLAGWKAQDWLKNIIRVING
jgi:hypothetical protein